MPGTQPELTYSFAWLLCQIGCQRWFEVQKPCEEGDTGVWTAVLWVNGGMAIFWHMQSEHLYRFATAKVQFLMPLWAKIAAVLVFPRIRAKAPRCPKPHPETIAGTSHWPEALREQHEVLRVRWLWKELQLMAVKLITLMVLFGHCMTRDSASIGLASAIWIHLARYSSGTMLNHANPISSQWVLEKHNSCTDIAFIIWKKPMDGHATSALGSLGCMVL